MPVFWITINSVDLKCPIIISLANVELELSCETQSAFYYKTRTMNPIAVAKFFYIRYDVIFLLLFATSQAE